MTSLSGRRTAKRRGAVRFSTSLTSCSSISISAALWPLPPTPTASKKLRKPSGGNPRRRRAETVGIRGSSQPRTEPSLTSRPKNRFESTVYVRLRRGDLDLGGGGGTRRVFFKQSDRGR